MAKKTTKKAVIFIVEGKSDKKALEHIFQIIYKHKNVTFEFTRGDVTSDETLTLNEVVQTIYEKVKSYRKEKKLNKNDEYYGAAEPPVRCGESHLSGLTEPPHFVY